MARKGTQLSKIQAKPQYALGPEEVAQRDLVGYQPPGKAFKQMNTGVSTRDANKPTRTAKGGAFKFGNGV
jgi:hypothetical protein